MTIAGILTDFDPLLYDYSNIYYYSDEERFEVLFDKVRIYNSVDVNFTFSITLFPNGIVQMTYHDIPSYEDIFGILPPNLIYKSDNEYHPFYYSGIIGEKGRTTPQTYERDEAYRDYDIKAHQQLELTPINSFKSNNSILFCPMAEKVCITPYYIDPFRIYIYLYLLLFIYK